MAKPAKTVPEMCDALTLMLTEWVDEHPGHDSGNADCQGELIGLGDDLEQRLKDLLFAARVV